MNEDEVMQMAYPDLYKFYEDRYSKVYDEIQQLGNDLTDLHDKNGKQEEYDDILNRIDYKYALLELLGKLMAFAASGKAYRLENREIADITEMLNLPEENFPELHEWAELIVNYYRFLEERGITPEEESLTARISNEDLDRSFDIIRNAPNASKEEIEWAKDMIDHIDRYTRPEFEMPVIDHDGNDYAPANIKGAPTKENSIFNDQEVVVDRNVEIPVVEEKYSEEDVERARTIMEHPENATKEEIEWAKVVIDYNFTQNNYDNSVMLSDGQRYAPASMKGAPTSESSLFNNQADIGLIYNELSELKKKLKTTSGEKFSKLNKQYETLSLEMERLLGEQNQDIQEYYRSIADLDEQIEKLRKTIAKRSLDYYNSFLKIRGIMAEQSESSYLQMDDLEFQGEIDRLMNENTNENNVAQTIREEISRQNSLLTMLLKRKNLFELAQSIKLTPEEYKELVEKEGSYELLHSIIVRAGFEPIISTPYQLRSSEQRRQLAEQHDVIMAEFRRLSKVLEESSVLDSVDSVHKETIPERVTIEGHPRVLIINNGQINNITINIGTMPEKVVGQDENPEGKEPGKAPDDMQDVMNNQDIVPNVVHPEPETPGDSDVNPSNGQEEPVDDRTPEGPVADPVLVEPEVLPENIEYEEVFRGKMPQDRTTRTEEQRLEWALREAGIDLSERDHYRLELTPAYYDEAASDTLFNDYILLRIRENENEDDIDPVEPEEEYEYQEVYRGKMPQDRTTRTEEQRLEWALREAGIDLSERDNYRLELTPAYYDEAASDTLFNDYILYERVLVNHDLDELDDYDDLYLADDDQYDFRDEYPEGVMERPALDEAITQRAATQGETIESSPLDIDANQGLTPTIDNTSESVINRNNDPIIGLGERMNESMAIDNISNTRPLNEMSYEELRSQLTLLDSRVREFESALALVESRFGAESSVCELLNSTRRQLLERMRTIAQEMNAAMRRENLTEISGRVYRREVVGNGRIPQDRTTRTEEQRLEWALREAGIDLSERDNYAIDIGPGYYDPAASDTFFNDYTLYRIHDYDHGGSNDSSSEDEYEYEEVYRGQMPQDRTTRTEDQQLDYALREAGIDLSERDNYRVELSSAEYHEQSDGTLYNDYILYRRVKAKQKIRTPETRPGTDTVPGTEPGIGTVPGTEPGIGTGPGTEPGIGTGPGTEPGIGTGPGTEPGIGEIPKEIIYVYLDMDNNEQKYVSDEILARLHITVAGPIVKINGIDCKAIDDDILEQIEATISVIEDINYEIRYREVHLGKDKDDNKLEEIVIYYDEDSKRLFITDEYLAKLPSYPTIGTVTFTSEGQTITANEISQDTYFDIEQTVNQDSKYYITMKKIELEKVNLRQEEVIIVYEDEEKGHYLSKENLDKFSLNYDPNDPDIMIEGAPCRKISEDQHEALKKMADESQNPHYRIEYRPYQKEKKVDPDIHYQTVINKLTKDLFIKKNDGKRYQASNIKVWKTFWDELHSGNVLYNIVHFVPGLVKAGFNFIRKLTSKILLSKRGKTGMQEFENRFDELSEEEKEVLLRDYKGHNALQDMNTQINPVLLPKIKEYAMQKLAKMNQDIEQSFHTLLAILGQIDALDRQAQANPDANIQETRSALMQQAGQLCIHINEVRSQADDLLSSGIHGLEEDFKAVSTKLNYVGKRFAKTHDFNNELQEKLAQYGQGMNHAIAFNDYEGIVDNFMKYESLYSENTKIKGSIFGKRSVGEKYYTPLATVLDYRNDPFVSDLFTTIAVVATTVGTIKALDYNRQVQAANKYNADQFNKVRTDAGKIEGHRGEFAEGSEAVTEITNNAHAGTNERGALDGAAVQYGSWGKGYGTPQYTELDEAAHHAYNNLNSNINTELTQIAADKAAGLITEAQAFERLTKLSESAYSNLQTVCQNGLSTIRQYQAAHPNLDISAFENSMAYIAAHPDAITNMNGAMLDTLNLANGLTQIQGVSVLGSDWGKILGAISAATIVHNVGLRMSNGMRHGKYGNSITDAVDEYRRSGASRFGQNNDPNPNGHDDDDDYEDEDDQDIEPPEFGGHHR